jgi:hypothetical protein
MDSRPLSELDTEMMRELVAESTAAGIRRAVESPDTWAAIGRGLRGSAEREAGGMLLKGLRVVVGKVLLVVLVGMGVYMVGGWSALASFFGATVRP